LFASDSPWSDQQESMALIKRLSLDKNLEEKILGINAMRLLEL
jgi:predicted TIM-barrel fold metal-dependent hydrolase